jgi:pentatricopeptide repeat protein
VCIAGARWVVRFITCYLRTPDIVLSIFLLRKLGLQYDDLLAGFDVVYFFDIFVCFRLRSYGPALHTFCKSKNIDKAFEVDEHMVAAGVQPEEGELEALLKLTVDAGLEDKVYSLLHRIRTTVRGLSPSTASVVKQWFESSAGASAGRTKWDALPNPETVKAAYESRGGGWHGLGWLGRGSWEVKPSALDASGVCRECGEQLVTIDIDPKETELFAKSLSELACQRESKNNEFKKFQVLRKHEVYLLLGERWVHTEFVELIVNFRNNHVN